MSSTERVVLELPSELAATLRAGVASGQFPSEEEFVGTLLRVYQLESGFQEEQSLESIRAFVAEGVADADAGRLSEANEVYERVLAQIAATEADSPS